jgi:hypothetical protein
MNEVGIRDDDVEVHPPGLQIYSQGLRDGACLLYAVANTYKALTGNKVTRDKWNGAVSQLADPATFLTGDGARHLEDREVVAVIEGMLGAFAEPGEHFDLMQLPASAGIAEMCAAVSERSVVLFAYSGETEFLEVDDHIVCGVAASEDAKTLHIACSAALWMRHVDHAGYFERSHRHLNRYSNDSISAECRTVVAPNWRWLVSIG